MQLDSAAGQSPSITRSPFNSYQKFFPNGCSINSMSNPNLHFKPNIQLSSGNIGSFTGPFYNSTGIDTDGSHVHLIPTDLWEAITGERLSAQHICHLCEYAIPGYNGGGPALPIPIVHSQNPPISVRSENNLDELNQNYVKMARDRTGSRNLQQQIEECSKQERRQIFSAILPSLPELVYDQSSNYVIQKLCEYLDYGKPNTAKNEVVGKGETSGDYGDFDERFLKFFLSDIKHVVDHPNSCRVLQKYIEHTTNIDHVDKIYVGVRDELNSMCTSPNGNHIVQRFIEMLPARVSEVVNAIKPYVSSLVIDSCGCRVVQKLFDKYDIKLLRPLVDEVLVCADSLATDQYGNYVVQNILNSGPDSDIAALIKQFKGSFCRFSTHKFASNVIEKCIRRATPEQRDQIFDEIISGDGKYKEDHILKMVTDQFGNYVMQRIIEFGSESQQTAIYEVVYDNYDEATKNNYARHVINRLEDLGYEF